MEDWADSVVEVGARRVDCDDWIDWCGCVCTALDRAFSAGGVLWGWHHHHDYENVRLENDHDYGNVRLESDFDFGNVHLENVRDYGNVRLENDFEKSRNGGLGHGIVFDRHQIALEIVSLLLRWERERTRMDVRSERGEVLVKVKKAYLTLT